MQDLNKMGLSEQSKARILADRVKQDEIRAPYGRQMDKVKQLLYRYDKQDGATAVDRASFIAAGRRLSDMLDTELLDEHETKLRDIIEHIVFLCQDIGAVYKWDLPENNEEKDLYDIVRRLHGLVVLSVGEPRIGPLKRRGE